MITLLAAFLRTFVKLLGRVIYRLRITGASNIPSEGGALLVGNHTSYMDFVLMVCLNSRPVSFVMNADIYKKPFLRPLLKALNCVPISPRTGKNDFESFNKAVSEQVNAGYLVAIFAEGTVSRTGQILEFKKGVEHLSKLITGPVVPIHFDNVSGTPFSYRAGRKNMLRFSFSTLRRKVRINVGVPIQGGVSAFALRQCIKELEVENFSKRLMDQPTISTRIGRMLSNEPVGFWKYEGKKHAYSNLPEQLSKLGAALGKSLEKETTVAVLLPKGPQSMLIYLWLLMNKKTIVPIDPNWTNEQRLFAINRSNAGLLITTKDINFSHWAPTENAVVFIDELEASMEKGVPVNVICKNLKVARKRVMSLFTSAKAELPVALFFEKEKRELVRAIPVYQQQINAVIIGLRQVYHFDKGSSMLCDLEMHNSFGFVLEFLLPLMSDFSVEMLPNGATDEQFANTLTGSSHQLVIASPGQLTAVSALAEKRNIAELTHIFTADIHPLNATVQSLNNRGISVLTCAGLNESSSVFAVNLLNINSSDIVGRPLFQEASDADSIGKPLPGVAVKICKPKDYSVELPSGEVGEILIKGPAVLDQNIEGGKRIFNDGWLVTGWCGYIDHKGFVHRVEGKGERGDCIGERLEGKGEILLRNVG